MEHFPLKFTPICEAVKICSGDPIPERYRNAIIAEYDRLYPNIDLLFSVSRQEGFFSFFDRTQEGFYPIANFKAIVLSPVGPAKGSGYILLLAMKTNPYSPTYLLSVDGYNDTKEQWMRECGQNIATMISLPYEEHSLGADA